MPSASSLQGVVPSSAVLASPKPYVFLQILRLYQEEEDDLAAQVYRPML